MRFKDSLFFHTGRDGGPRSRVMGYWIVRIKALFSIAVLCFDAGSREAFHSHAFNSISWVLTGGLREVNRDGTEHIHRPDLKPVRTYRDTFHKVYGLAPKTWVLTFRGPWVDHWREVEESGREIILTHNRIEVQH